MTVGFRAATGATAGAVAALTWALPTGHATEDLLLAAVGWKPFGTTCPTPSGYAARGDKASGSVAPAGNDTGSTRVAAFTKVDGGSESAPTATLSTTPNVSLLGMLALTKTAGMLWDVASTDGSQTGTSTAVSIAGASALTWQPGDLALVLSTCTTDALTLTATALAVPGITFGAGTQRLSPNVTATGADLALFAHTFPVTAGTGTGTPTFTGTVTSHNQETSALILRLREVSAAAAAEIHNGTDWKTTAEVWNGTSWRTDAEVWNGTSWVAL